MNTISETERVPPLTPSDLDLRKSHGWMPVDVQALLRSTFTIRSTGDEFKAGTLLWFESWHQVPAASLPNDDTELCYLAGLGRDLDKWQLVKKMAMRNFTLATDGRWYHRVVAEKANGVFEEQKRKSEQGKKGARKRWKEEPGQGDMLEGCPGIGGALAGQSPDAGDESPSNANREEQNRVEQNKSKQNKSEGLPPSCRSGGRECRIPEKWIPNRAEIRIGLERGFTESETKKHATRFHNYWLGRTGVIAVKADWVATFRNWLDTEAEKLGRAPKTVTDEGDAVDKLAYEVPRNGEAITAAMCLGEDQKRHIGRIYLHRESDEWNAWTFHYGEVARKKGQWPPPTVPTHFSSGWSFPACWPPGHPNASPATE